MTFDELLQCPPYFVKNAPSTRLSVGAVYRIIDPRTGQNRRADHRAYIHLISINEQLATYEYLTLYPEYNEQTFHLGSAFADMLCFAANSLTDYLAFQMTFRAI